MKKKITFIIALIISHFLNAQAPDSWTEKNGVGLNVTASMFGLPEPRGLGVGCNIGTKGYFGTGYTGNAFRRDFWEFDPASGSWTRKADLSLTSRSNAVAFSIGTKCYCGTGTTTSSIELKDFWEYDPSTNSWTQKADFGGIARYGAVGFSIGNKGYIGTGFNNNSFSDFWEYDPSTNSWNQKANFGGIPRNRATDFSIGNKGYIGTGGDIGQDYNDFWEYDQTANTWTQKANFGGAARSDAAGFRIGNKGYIGTGSHFRDFWEYDPSINQWTQKAIFGGSGREYATGFNVGNNGYIGFGRDTTANHKNDLWKYDPVANQWTQVIGSARDRAAGFSIGSKGYIGTGKNSFTYFNDFWEFEPLTNVWTQKANFGGTARYLATGFSIGNKGYIGTGSDVSGLLKKDFWEYNPVLNVWTQKANFGGVNRAGATGISIGGKGYIGLGVDSNVIHQGDFWQYNPVSDTWFQKANFGGVPRSYATGFSIGNRGFIGTGDTSNFGLKNDFWEYNPLTNIWTQKANFGGVARFYAAGFSVGSKGYIGTGYGTGGYKSDFWEYDPSANAWSQKANLGSSPRAYATGFSIGSHGYVGTGSYNYRLGDFWEYTPICSTPPSTIYSSGNISFCNGDSVFLFANNGYNYQWKKNGVDITGATSYFHYAKTTGNYTCYLTNSCGAVTSSAISVTVNSLPSATITPAGLTTFCSGESVVLNVPSGANKIYQWKKGANLISGATLSSYTATTGGNYRVIVTNTATGCSKTTNSATVVTVNALPAATITPQGPTTFCAGGSVVLAANTGAGLTYKWKKGSNFISGATLSNYTATIGGNYRVQVTNGNGCSKTSALVAVSVPCKEGESVNAGEGESVFDVNVYPNPNSGEFTIRFLNKPDAMVQIEMTDELGKVVKRFETSEETVVIKELNLAKGIYCLTGRNDNEVVIKKINIVK